jgi:glycosyltransferase involved in cell wall biosynthesis
MRVALIATSLRRAGAEKQFFYAARTLHEAGIDARVYYLGAGDHYQTILANEGIPLRQIFNPHQSFLMLLRLIKELIAFRPHIVLASQFGDLLFAGVAGRVCGALVLGGVRSDGFYELRTAGRRSWLMLKLSHGLIANSDRAKDNLISLGNAAQKIAVVPNVIDLADFDQKMSRPFQNSAWDNRIPVTAVGSLQYCKRFDRFLDGLALARQREPSLFGVIAGDDLGEKAALERKSDALRLLPDHLQFLGDCAQIPSLLAGSRMLVSCSEYEGFPNVILEAMAARLPVLITPVGDARRIMKDGVAGYLLQPDDPRGMAERIVSLARDPAQAHQMGEAGRKLVERDYNITSLAPRLLSVFSVFAVKHRKAIAAGSQPTRMLEPVRANVAPGSPPFLRLGTFAPPIRTKSSRLASGSLQRG